MITVKVTFTDVNTITTPINATIEEAKKYYVGKWFNFGVDGDHMVKAVSCEELTYETTSPPRLPTPTGYNECEEDTP